MAGVDAKTQEYFSKYPFGAADYTSTAYAATVAIEARNTLNFVKIGTLTGNVTVNLETSITLLPQSVTKSIERNVGDKLILVVTADGSNRTVALGTGISGADIVVTAAKTNVITLEYIDETLGYTVTNNQQID